MRAPRNPDLPIVDELRAELRARIRAEETRADRATPADPPPARRRLSQPERRRFGFAGRVTRRSAVIVLLLCLVAGVALAQLGTHGDGPPHNTDPQELGASASWKISGYRDEGRLCVLFGTGPGETANDCGSVPQPGQVRATSAQTESRRFVVGLTGSGVREVTVWVGRQRASAVTRTPIQAEEARMAGVPRGVRWFVVGAGLGTSAAPAHIIARDRSGERLGRPLLDCSLDLAGRACERAYEDRAFDRLR